MSFPVNYNKALAISDVPFKIFIRESNQSSSETPNKISLKLKFEGDEAKKAYEEIISIQNERKSLPRKCNSIPINYNDKPKTSVKNVDKKVDNVNVNTLFKAIESGDENFIRQHFHTENVNITDQFEWSPLMSASYAGHIKVVKFLLGLGANTKIKDKSGKTAIDLAYKKHNLDIVNLLKQYSSKKNKKESVKSNNKISQDNRESDKTKDQEEFYCDLCKVHFMESSRKKHETSTLHVFNSKPKINVHYGIPRQNVGYQMLVNSGWDNEGGLGPTGQGQQYPVKTILKRDRKGLGQQNKHEARVTHFNARDPDAIRHVHKDRRKSYRKKDWLKQMSKDAAKTRALRQALS